MPYTESDTQSDAEPNAKSYAEPDNAKYDGKSYAKPDISHIRELRGLHAVHRNS